jgi:shikimate kinase
MKTVFIYGAPGVGKFTTAKALAKATGYRLIHNHLLIDLVGSVFPHGSTEFTSAARFYRLDLMDRAAKARTKGLILTFVYKRPIYDSYVRALIRQAKRHRGKVFAIHLVCDRKTLFQRITHPARKNFRKITTRTALQETLNKDDLFADIPGLPSLTIDNTAKSPLQVARHIEDRCRL